MMSLLDSLLDPFGAGAFVFVLMGVLYPLVILGDQMKHKRFLLRHAYWSAWKRSFWLVSIVMPSILLFVSTPTPQGSRAWLGAYGGWLLAGALLWLLRDSLSIKPSPTVPDNEDYGDEWKSDHLL